MKKGFGLLEVLVAAVVLGFLIVGLNNLQKGNREAVLRVRARDAANFIAQHVLDSLGSVGLNSIKKLDPSNTLVYYNENYSYVFEGNKGITIQNIPYKVSVVLMPTDVDFKSMDTTKFTRNNGNTAAEENTFAKSLEATVKWKFKESEQSIQVAKVVR